VAAPDGYRQYIEVRHKKIKTFTQGKNAVKVFGGFGNLFSKRFPKKSRPRIPTAEPAGWWHLTAIGSTYGSIEKNKNSHAHKNAVKVFEGFGELFSKSSPRKSHPFGRAGRVAAPDGYR